METAVRPDEVSAILKKELAGFEQKADVYDAGTVLQVGDGIARVYGLEKVMAGELVMREAALMTTGMQEAYSIDGCSKFSLTRL